MQNTTPPTRLRELIKKCLFLTLGLLFLQSLHAADPSPYGFGVVNNLAFTRPNDGPVVQVWDVGSLRTACAADGQRTIEIMQNLDVGRNGDAVIVRSGKTIRPGRNLRTGQLFPIVFTGTFMVKEATDVVIRNLRITQPRGGDGVSVLGTGAGRVLIFKCSIFNCVDTCVGITGQASHVTVAYCKFWNTTNNTHRFGSEFLAKGKHCYVTYHHNWFGSGLQYRMPRVGTSTSGCIGFAHVFNNHYETGQKQAQITCMPSSSILAERNSYHNSYNPWDFADFIVKDTRNLKPGIYLKIENREPYFTGSLQWSSNMIRYQYAVTGDRIKRMTNYWLYGLYNNYDNFVNYNYSSMPGWEVAAHVKYHSGTQER